MNLQRMDVSGIADDGDVGAGDNALRHMVVSSDDNSLS